MKKGSILVYFCLAVALALALFPPVWIIRASLLYRDELFVLPPDKFFSTTENYIKVLAESPFSTYLLNSVIVSSATVLLTLLIGVPAAYTFSRYRIKGHDNLRFFIISTRMGPAVAYLIPFFLIFSQLGLLDSQLSLIILYLTFNVGFAVWMVKGFFDEIPAEIEQAALLDGYSRFGAFMKIALPLIAPGIAATAVLCFIFSWNEFMFALTITREASKTVPVAISGYIGWVNIEWEEMSAAGVITMLPILAIAYLAQKYIVKGLTFGAIR